MVRTLAIAIPFAVALLGWWFVAHEGQRWRMGIAAELDAQSEWIARATRESAGRLEPWENSLGTDLEILDAAGRVVGGSAVGALGLDRSNEPDVREAARSGRGERVTERGLGRPSLMVVTRRYGDRFIRLRRPLGDVDHALRALVAAVAAVVLVCAGSVAAALWGVIRPVRELTAAARSMADGNLSARAPASLVFQALSPALNRVAERLNETINQLQRERNQLAGILDGMSEGVLVIDAHRRVELANVSFRELTASGGNWGDIVGQSVEAVLRNSTLSDALDHALLKGETESFEIELPTLPPRIVFVRTTPRANTAGVIAVLHDVTHVRKLETIRTDFVANVSHELRTPIAAVLSAAETLRSGALGRPADAERFVEMIERHGQRLRNLVDDLLDLSRIESKSFELSLTAQDVVPMVESSLGLVRETARARGIEIVWHPPAARMLALVERRALEQVLVNLLDNAIKYSGDGRRVEVAVEDASDAVLVSVQDNGAGIAPEHLDRIFERFYRVDASRSRELGGTGLGLSIVRHLVERLGGGIRATSKVGQGSRFVVQLRKRA